MSKNRDYRREYKNYHGSAEQRKKRSQRVMARRKAMEAGMVKKGDGNDLAHKDNNVFNDKLSNFEAQSPSQNRSFARDKKARRLK
jgi:hypothetical protein